MAALSAFLGAWSLIPSIARGLAGADEMEARALAYLAREVPRWSRENGCFSCHNDGVGAAALFAAAKARPAPPHEATADTLAFLSHPERWEKNGVDAAFSDKRLAAVQFASATAMAVRAGRIADRDALAVAADMVAKGQAEDGSWPIDEAAPVGSPATLGPPLATAMAVSVLRQGDEKRHDGTIARAELWLRTRPIVNLHEAAAVLMALSDDLPSDRAARRKANDLLRRGQNDDGGWGPFVRSASEPFDTAIALIALARLPRSPEVNARIHRGRAYLVASQREDGSWPETTRPSGGESYAQRVATSGWATRALLETRPAANVEAGRP